MERKKLKLKISEISPKTDQLRISTGLPGPCPCGPGGMNSVTGTANAGGGGISGFLSGIANHPGNNAISNAALENAIDANYDNSLGLSASLIGGAAMTCDNCHP